ncbi:hypothetical protein H6G81_15030 [Scytonema hofmannii FACHB-248]|uniref:Uncharacterized protein n=1 Tax=Scytonema hofmannii FACHB-248 TaxID=1842502 RepID=A0ABR8GQR9_9CYAN|nr:MULTISPECIES: hypothetical protein [Nostocales]MBD2605794.1 hypothetical protein [Scytonema hofmannii FACHB-248]
MFLRFAYIGLSLLSIAITFYVKAQLEKFLENNTAIANDKSLEEYKSIVRLNMYGALAQIIIFISAFGSCVAYIVTQGFTGVFSLFMLGFAVSFMKQISQLEEKARSLTCATTQLDRQYKNISHVWKKKALPDF